MSAGTVRIAAIPEILTGKGRLRAANEEGRHNDPVIQRLAKVGELRQSSILILIRSAFWIIAGCNGSSSGTAVTYDRRRIGPPAYCPQLRRSGWAFSP